jgi:hypothetical protein
MQLLELLHAEPNFNTLTPREKICLFSWYLHRYAGIEVLTTGKVRDCFTQLSLAPPNVATYLERMATMAPIQLLTVRGGYKLEGNLARQMDVKYGQHPSVIMVQKLLADLPAKIPNINERVFLEETLNCYKVKAFRAAIVMAWNLAFDHLLRWIIADAGRLAAFNASIPKRYPKRTSTIITNLEDFSEEFKESELLEVCRNANLITKNQKEMLDEKLKRRNACAHPSSLIVKQPQADDVISDLVNNVVLQLT